MPSAMNGNEFHPHFGVVAPEYLLDVTDVSTEERGFESASLAFSAAVLMVFPAQETASKECSD
jgi:hypothetical protein